MNTSKKISTIDNIEKKYVAKDCEFEIDPLIKAMVSKGLYEKISKEIHEILPYHTTSVRCDDNFIQSLSDAVNIVQVKSIFGTKLEDFVFLLTKTNDLSEIWAINKNGYVDKVDIYDYRQDKGEISIESINAFKDVNYLEDDIKALKKRIKHAKSPLEQKALQKQLNEAYKKVKRKKHERK